MAETKLVDFWIIVFQDYSNIEYLVDNIRKIQDFEYCIHILDNSTSPEPFVALQELEVKYRELGTDITIIKAPENLYWSKGMNYLITQTPNTPYIFYLCSRHITIKDISGFTDILQALQSDLSIAQAGDLVRCAGLYYFKAQNAPYRDPNSNDIHRFPHILPKLEGKFDLDTIFSNSDTQLHIQGGLFGMNRKAFIDIGGCDEALLHYYTDLELSVRFQCEGYKLQNLTSIFSSSSSMDRIPEEKQYKILHTYEVVK